MKTLQEHYNAIKKGQGNKTQFLKQARHLFPEYFNQYSTYDSTVSVLKSKQIISEAAGGVVSKGFDIWDWKKILAEETKAVEKETSKEVLDYRKNAYDNANMKNADNVNFNEIMKGFYCEMKDEKNKDKTGDELKAMVVKNLAKDPLYYTKNGEFGTKEVGYTTEAPGLGEPKAPKGKHKSSGYGDLKEGYDSKAGLSKKEQDKISTLSKEEKKALYDDLTDAVSDVNDQDFKDKASYAKAMKDVKTKIYKKYNILEENTDILDYYASTIEANNMTEDEAYAYLQDIGLPYFQINKIIDYVFPIKADEDIPSQGMTEEQKLRSIIQQIIQEEIDEVMYQGPSVKPLTGPLGGRRFIPTITALSRDAVDAINAKGLKRLNWEKPHIKVIKSGEGVKLMISKLLLDTIVGAQRGRSKLPLSVSKSGTGITPMETSELTGEFKKLVKVLSANGKLSQTGDYYLLDIDTKYNSEKNQFEMPLPKELGEIDITGTAGNPEEEEAAKSVQIKKPNPKATTEQKLRSLINNIIKEELNENLIPHDKITYNDEGKEVKKERLFLDKKYNIIGKKLTPDEKYDYAKKGISVGKNQEIKPFSIKEELNENLKFNQVENGRKYLANMNFGIFKKGDEVFVDRVRNLGTEVVLELYNSKGEPDSIKGDLEEEVEVFGFY